MKFRTVTGAWNALQCNYVFVNKIEAKVPILPHSTPNKTNESLEFTMVNKEVGVRDRISCTELFFEKTVLIIFYPLFVFHSLYFLWLLEFWVNGRKKPLHLTKYNTGLPLWSQSNLYQQWLSFQVRWGAKLV